MKKTKLLLFSTNILFLILLFSSISKSQKFELQTGLNFQTTLMNFIDFDELLLSGPYALVPYNYERNVQGIGLDVAIKYSLNDRGLKLRYQLQGRYDETYYEVLNSKTIPVKNFILNHSMELLKNDKQGNWYSSFGIHIFNPFIKIPYEDLSKGENLSLTFVGYSIGRGLLWGKQNLNDITVKAYYVLPGDIPFFNSSNGYLTYSVGLKRTLVSE